MRQLIISSMPVLLWAMTLFDGIAIFAMYISHRENHLKKIPYLTMILCMGLFYDSLILSLGAFLKFGPLLKILSQFRFIFHCVLIPLLFPICGYALKLSEKKMRIIRIVTLILMISGAIAGIGVITEERTVGAIRRYAQSDLTNPFSKGLISLLDVVPVFIMIGIGIYLYIRKKDPHMFLSGFFMLLFTMLGIFLGKDPGGDKSQSLMFYISMYGEALMVYFLYRFVKREEELEK
ncbi:MAG: hypothetical protein IJK53_07615 [Erysipelotrichaceae bacterium]|nr:hypothetical protein [Erysipelotrichaceae bacterium]